MCLQNRPVKVCIYLSVGRAVAQLVEAPRRMTGGFEFDSL